MLDFRTSQGPDFMQFGRDLWLAKEDFQSHEQASQYIVEQLFREFITEDGDPEIALVRIFRLTQVEDLPDSVRANVGAGEKRVMALTGTWGIEKNWQHRTLSRGHQAIPISYIAVPKKIPMFQAVLGELGIDLEHFYKTQELVAANHRPYQGTFLIDDATSPVIPDQDSFIHPYGIRSFIGFGGFMGADLTMYLLCAFCRRPISLAAAQSFYRMQEFIGASIAVEQRIFDTV